MNFLKLSGKTILVFGVANRKSVGFAVGEVLEEMGARVVYVVRNEERKEQLAKVLKEPHVHVCDVENDHELHALKHVIDEQYTVVHGIVHSIAFANYSEGARPFHETKRDDFLQAMQVSCHSLIEIANVFKDKLDPEGSVVTISISTTNMAAENYGYMA